MEPPSSVKQQPSTTTIRQVQVMADPHTTTAAASSNLSHNAPQPASGLDMPRSGRPVRNRASSPPQNKPQHASRIRHTGTKDAHCSSRSSVQPHTSARLAHRRLCQIRAAPSHPHLPKRDPHSPAPVARHGASTSRARPTRTPPHTSPR
ncbi:hypothetical protein ZWY2020_004877 [Hordeum vulgare]|nr:hypothetical protein ZWY2020_004877 [Hordeum vulgare]